LVVAILAIGIGLVVWKNKVGGHSSEALNSVSKAELELLLADVAKNNPMILKRFKDNPEEKKKQIENLRELLAFASQAQREGLADDPNNREEIKSIKAEVIAVNYDKEMNKDKGPMPAFGFITEEQVAGYWAEGSTPAASRGFVDGIMDKLGLGAPIETRTHEEEFDAFLNSKIAILKTGNPEMAEKEISEEEKTQARDVFAKIRIYKAEYDKKAQGGELPKEFVDRTNLQVKLQQAQFLARIYSQKVTDKIKVTDEDVTKYIAEHPELDPAAKRAKAQGILDRAKAGEDFAALANEFSEDPGNKGVDGAGKGGIYTDVPKGQMVAPFEQAALALEAGQVSPELVETDFGFHIIKLERKLGPSPKKDGDKEPTAPGAPPAPTGDTYDVRHILISTGVKDPENPTAREAPVKDYVRNKLESEKEKKLLDDIVAANNVQVPADFDVPEVTEEQMEQMRQKQQMQMPPGGPQGMPPGGPQGMPPGGPDGPKPAKPAPKKPEAKK